MYNIAIFWAHPAASHYHRFQRLSLKRHQSLSLKFVATGVGSLCPGVRYRSRACFANNRTASKLAAIQSRSTAKRFSVKWRSSHQAPPSACAVPRTKVIGKTKLFSPHLSSIHHSQSLARKPVSTLAQKKTNHSTSTLNIAQAISQLHFPSEKQTAT